MTLDDWRVLALQELLLLLLGRGVRVALVVSGAGDARRGAAVVLVNVFRVATQLLVDAPPIGALAFSFSLALAF